MSKKHGSDILAFSCSYHDQGDLKELISDMRGTAGVWFDWFLCLGAPSKRLKIEAQDLLADPEHYGIQYLKVWKENRGQHHATAEALKLARKEGYKWLLRIDPDVRSRTKRWLKKMVERLEKLKSLKEDEFYRFVASPKIIGLNNPIPVEGVMEGGQSFLVEMVPLLGGACRLHPIELMGEYEPPLYDPIGRGDPDSLAVYLGGTIGGMQIRFPDIRVVHNTDKIEAADTEEQATARKMSRHWPYLEAGV